MPFPQRGMESALMAGIAVRVYGIPHPTKTWMVTAAVPRSLEHVAAVPLVIALAWSITAPVQVLGAEKPDERHSTQYLWPSPDGAHAEPADVGLELLIAEVTGSKPRTGEAGDLPYPSSDLITDISFGDYAKYTPDRAGDNWPITWGDDGHQYTAWGDGRGPDHPDDERVSMGFARVEGNPPHVGVVKIDSPDEQSGGAAARPAACS